MSAIRRSCKVCNLDSDIIINVNKMMAIDNAGNATINSYFINELSTQPPSGYLLNKHRNENHYAEIDIDEIAKPLMKQFNNDSKIKSFNNTITSITVKMLPKLANLHDNIDIIDEKQELYAFTKNQFVKEMEMIKNNPIYVDDEKTGTSIKTNPLTRNAKDLMKLLLQQLDSIEKSFKENRGNESEIDNQLLFAFMKLFEETTLGIDDVINIISTQEINDGEYEEIDKVDVVDEIEIFDDEEVN